MVSCVDISFASDLEDQVGRSFSDFTTDFSTSHWREQAERAMRVSTNTDHKDTDATHFVQSKMRQYCPKHSCLVSGIPDKSPLRAEMCLTNFGMKQGSTHTSYEKSNLWTARLTTKGTRTVSIFDTNIVKNFLKNQGLHGKDPKQWLKEAPPAVLTEFLSIADSLGDDVPPGKFATRMFSGGLAGPGTRHRPRQFP